MLAQAPALLAQKDDRGRTRCCYKLIGNETGAGQVLVVPVVGDDDDGRIAGTPPLHQLLTTPFASIPHLHPVLGVGADDVGGEAREGKDKKAKKDMSKDLSLPTPDSLESGNLVGQQHLSQACLHQSFQTTSHSPSAADLHKLLKNVANLPAKKDATYKPPDRIDCCDRPWRCGWHAHR